MTITSQGKERTVAVVVALIAFGLMQAHNIEYWAGMTDWYRGPAFSIAIEAAALWLWYLRGWVARAFSVLASVLVIGGALFQVSEPLFARMHEAGAQQQLAALTRAEIADHQATLRQYENNSGKRLGWAPYIEDARADLEAARARLREELQHTVTTGMDWRTYAGIGLQALVLLVVMVSQVLAVIALRNSAPKQPVMRQRKAAVTPKSQPGRQPETRGADGITETDRRVTTVAGAIKERLPNFDGKQRALAEHYDLRPADVSMALNHASRKQQGKEVVTERALRRMESALGPASDEAAA